MSTCTHSIPHRSHHTQADQSMQTYATTHPSLHVYTDLNLYLGTNELYFSALRVLSHSNCLFGPEILGAGWKFCPLEFLLFFSFFFLGIELHSKLCHQFERVRFNFMLTGYWILRTSSAQRSVINLAKLVLVRNVCSVEYSLQMVDLDRLENKSSIYFPELGPSAWITVRL